jgi:ribosomal protein S18 acetylase RimI-like enzyme
LGRQFAEIFATAFVLPDHSLSWERTVFAVVDDATVGMACGYTADQHRRSTLDPIRVAPGNRFRRAMGVAFLRAFLRMIGKHAQGEFYLGYLAVDAEWRGRGIGSRLIGHMEERARSLGCARFTLDVSARNDAAERLYRRCGLIREGVAPVSTLRSLVVHRMAKEL